MRAKQNPYEGFNGQVQVVDASTLSANVRCKKDLYRVISIEGMYSFSFTFQASANDDYSYLIL